MMTPRRQRMLVVGLVLVGVTGAVALSLRAFQENLLYFYTPSKVLAGEPPAGKMFRLGGMVEEGSMRREEGDMEVRFDVTDNEHKLTVVYSGVLPDLFREGQGVIARGQLEPNGTFRAEEVLAKHDEKYMPPELADALAKQGSQPRSMPTTSGTAGYTP
ncbi:MAG: cytochrome c maturation protein CcmE [Gammaproteobacteria bacterium]